MAEEQARPIVIDVDALVNLDHADWLAILRLGEGRLSAGLIELLEKVVVGGVMNRKWSELASEVRALNSAMDELVNPKDPSTGGNSEGG